MKTIIHKAGTRGHANYDWLDTHYTFSFANYYDPERVHFGVLRVLNDDTIQGGSGFDRHPHDNMEIITIPLEGELEHEDSMGNTSIIRKNDVQVMSAGTGIFHSEYNRQPDTSLSLLQIWVLPNECQIKPRYDQRTFLREDRINEWQRIVSPDEPDVMHIHQDAWFSLISLEKLKTAGYVINKKNNGIYVFLIEGSADIEGISLDKRDGIGLWETDRITLKALTDAEILLMEVPMEDTEILRK